MTTATTPGKPDSSTNEAQRFFSDRNKVICCQWIGRFGNRCHSYLYGKHLEDKFGLKFYVTTPWEGSVLFQDPAPLAPAEFSELEFAPHDSQAHLNAVFNANAGKIRACNESHGDTVELIDPNRHDTYGQRNIAYSSLVTDAPWLYGKISSADIRRYFAFTDEVRNSPVYRELERHRGTYDVAHLRRTDIAEPGYQGGHAMVSRYSYLEAAEKFGADPRQLVWVSDDRALGWKWDGPTPVIGGQAFPWLPDFLKILFARRIFRSNSAFSTWAAWLSDAEIYSPRLDRFAPGDLLDCEFVKGNHPHWMGVQGEHANYEFRLADDPEPSHSDTGSAAHTFPATQPATPANPISEKPWLLMTHWNGRFGNRMSSYLFGLNYARQYGCEFVIPSEWEGTRLFKHQDATVLPDDHLRLHLNQSQQPFDNFNYRAGAVREFAERTGKTLRHLNPSQPENYGAGDVFFDSLCVSSPRIYESYRQSEIAEWFEFSDLIKNLNVYKRLEDIQGTYDIAHLRRDDISSPAYNANNFQLYSVVSKRSYREAFLKYGFDEADVEWSTDDRTGQWIANPVACQSAGWSYPVGSHEIPEIVFDWLPDFLRLYFARTIFRSNSSFSWWAAQLSPCARVYSPILEKRTIYRKAGDEIDCEFVEGNHPHWLHCRSDPEYFDLRIRD